MIHWSPEARFTGTIDNNCFPDWEFPLEWLRSSPRPFCSSLYRDYSGDLTYKRCCWKLQGFYANDRLLLLT